MFAAEDARETQAPQGPAPGPEGPLGPAIRDESQLTGRFVHEREE